MVITIEVEMLIRALLSGSIGGIALSTMIIGGYEYRNEKFILSFIQFILSIVLDIIILS